MKINKKSFTNLLKKAYLSELNDELIIQFHESKIVIPFFIGAVGGIITKENSSQEPFEMVVVNVTNLLKQMSILDEEFEMSFVESQNRFIQMKDKKFENNYRLSDKSLLQNDHLKIYDFQEPSYDVKMDFGQEFVKDILDMKSTIKSDETTSIQLKSMGEKKLEFILGDYNKIKYKTEFEKLNQNSLEINAKFNFKNFISLLEQIKDVKNGTIFYKKPFIKIQAQCSDDVNVNYFIVQNQN